MYDIHSHLLFGIDDGSKSIEESIDLLKKMEKAGIEKLMLTPHYIENSKYNCNNEKKEEIFKELKKRAKEENIHIDLYLGNECYYARNLLELIERKEVRTLNKSKYILFEFPLRQGQQGFVSETVSSLVSNGYIPILAHPERYEFLQKYPSIVEEYLRLGIQLQGNFTSLFGKYGRKPQKNLKYFLKKKWISLLGSDTHHEVNFDVKKLEKKLLRITKDPEYVEKLMKGNFETVINNEELGMIR